VNGTEEKQGHVYLIRAIGTNRYKIGMTSPGRIEKRFAELSSGQSCYPLKLLGWIDTTDRFEAELRLHTCFKSYRKFGEWFEFSPQELARVEAEMEALDLETSQKNSGINFRMLLAGIVMIVISLGGLRVLHSLEAPPHSSMTK
jgi:Meiotically up-regulated gene 113